MDISILYFIREYFLSDFMTSVMSLLTLISNHAEVWIVTAFILIFIKQPYINDNHKSYFFKKYRIYGLLLIISLIAAVLLSEMIIKNFIARPRPFIQYPDIVLFIPAPSGYSFPSSHSATSFACAFIIFRLNHKSGIIAYIVAILVAFSRLYFMVHFPTDVIAGIIIGSICATTVYIIAKKYLIKKDIRI